MWMCEVAGLFLGTGRREGPRQFPGKVEQLPSRDCTTGKRLLLACTQGWGSAPQWVVVVKAAIKGKRGLLRKLAGTWPRPLAMLSLDGRAPLILLGLGGVYRGAPDPWVVGDGGSLAGEWGTRLYIQNNSSERWRSAHRVLI